MLKIIVLLSGASAFFIGPALAQEPAVPSPNPNAVSYVFDITRDGDKIGVDTLDISKDGDITTVKIGTHISVTAAFIEVYHFDHSGVETWNGNHFVSYKAKTDANGKKYSIAATADAGGKMNLTVNGQTTELSQLVLPATFWNSDFVTAAQMIDADKGALLSVQVADLGDEAIEQNGASLPNHRPIGSRHLARQQYAGQDPVARLGQFADRLRSAALRHQAATVTHSCVVAGSCRRGPRL
jgi:Domain of unknown function (DUF6134)